MRNRSITPARLNEVSTRNFKRAQQLTDQRQCGRRIAFASFVATLHHAALIDLFDQALAA